MSEQDQNPVFAIQRMYLKGMSLELPHAPAIFLESQQPTVEVQLDIGHSQVVEAIHEAVVTVTLTTKVADKVAFLIEVSQAGIFEIRHVPAEQMDILLNVVCANMIFPYLRANLADAVQRTGFPPIHLAEFNFEAIYQQRLEQAQQQQAAAPSLIVPGR